MPKISAAIAANINVTSRLSPAFPLITFANSKGNPVAPKIAIIILTVDIAISKRPNVTPPFAKLSATLIGLARISGFKKLRTKRMERAIIAEPAGEKPETNAMTTIEIGTTTSIKFTQSCNVIGSKSVSPATSTPKDRDSKTTVVKREA